MTAIGAHAEVLVNANDLRRATVRDSGTLLLWIGALLPLAGLAAIILSWTLLIQVQWISLVVVLGCFNIVAGANFAWWGDRFRHYDPLFPSGVWGAVFATGCLAMSSVVAVALLIYANYSLLSIVMWFQNN
ncbi:hypothetical protein N1027_11720 [Herbiconiux sp. CPCC 205763]|uniref:Uncharacterized protein n=1 Tax=Herbiconiux aconitum TaxID=2970913 RepID=A0ABT2GTA8_9MICO|nr:hypothetical protein [Herbiconiux aconitum]MCS5718802.1 hypothetical protein [Herbiconiux aconitum]